MPTYEYQCGACGQKSDIFQKMSDEPETKCPLCHASGLTKLISGGAFQLKGSGWYVTDYRDKGKAKAVETAETGTKTNESEVKSTETKSNDASSKNSTSE